MLHYKTYQAREAWKHHLNEAVGLRNPGFNIAKICVLAILVRLVYSNTCFQIFLTITLWRTYRKTDGQTEGVREEGPLKRYY